MQISKTQFWMSIRSQPQFKLSFICITLKRSCMTASSSIVRKSVQENEFPEPITSCTNKRVVVQVLWQLLFRQDPKTCPECDFYGNICSWGTQCNCLRAQLSGHCELVLRDARSLHLYNYPRQLIREKITFRTISFLVFLMMVCALWNVFGGSLTCGILTAWVCTAVVTLSILSYMNQSIIKSHLASLIVLFSTLDDNLTDAHLFGILRSLFPTPR